jgi:hypothetical protein
MTTKKIRVVWTDNITHGYAYLLADERGLVFEAAGDQRDDGGAARERDRVGLAQVRPQLSSRCL